MHWFASFLVKHPRGPLHFTCLVTVAAICGLSQLQFDEDLLKTLGSRTGELEEVNRFAEKIGFDERKIVAFLEADDLLSFSRISALRTFVEQVGARPQVLDIYSLLDARRPLVGRLRAPLFPEDYDARDVEQTRQVAAANPLVAGQTLTPDGRAAQVLISLADEMYADRRALDPLLDELRNDADRWLVPAGIRVRFVGGPIIRREIVAATRRDLVRNTALGSGVAICVALAFFRKPRVVFAVTAAPLLASLWIMGLLGLSQIPVNVLSATITNLTLVVGLTDSVHMIQDFQRRRRLGLDRDSALLESIRHAGAACGVTAVTTALGFASLAFTESPIIREYGMICAASSIMVFCVVMLLTVPISAFAEPPEIVRDGREPLRIERMTQRVVDFSLANRRWICFIAILLPPLLIVYSTRLEPNTRAIDYLPRSSPTREAVHDCERAFGGAVRLLVVVHVDDVFEITSPRGEAALRAIQQSLEHRPGMGKPLSLVNVVDASPNLGTNWSEITKYLFHRPRESFQVFYDPASRRLIYSVPFADRGSRYVLETVEQIRRDFTNLMAIHPGIRCSIGGRPVELASGANQMLAELASGLGLEALVILLVISFSLRSIKLGLISLVPNVLPLACVLGILSLLDTPLRFGVVAVFNVCLGLAVDDTVHLIKAIASSHKSATLEDQIREGTAGVGVPMLAAAAILAAGFGVLVFSEIDDNRAFGALACVTIAISIAIELLVLPALLSAFCRNDLRRIR